RSPSSTPKRRLCVVPGTVGDASSLHGGPSVSAQGGVARRRFRGSGMGRAERPSEQELRRAGLSGSARLHVQQFRRERGERRFQRAASGALKSNRVPPGPSRSLETSALPHPCLDADSAAQLSARTKLATSGGRGVSARNLPVRLSSK